ncbi:G-type lectin S-receptor serine/threonine-protein kinase [Spatholobus suberectus]|nr:G-type lectin S-receptor serine/threonine-protein kinase [Spatholobus suberectus]
MEGFTLLLFCLAMLNNIAATTVRDTINTVQSISDGQIIVSAGEIFALGFFSPGNSKNRYVGIWYYKIPIKTVVWVANRDNPLPDSSGVLKLDDTGVLVLFNHNKSVIWSSNSTRKTQYPVAKLMDSGNFVVQESGNNDPKDLLWQSFDYPVDTVLPGQKLGKNLVTGLNWYLSSWNSPDDPSQGIYNILVDTGGYAQYVLRKGTVKIFRFGAWNGIHSSGSPQVKQNSELGFNYVSNEEEIYITYYLINKSSPFRMVLATEGILRGIYWSDEENGWKEFGKAPVDDCDYYEKCGAYASCNVNNVPPCDCLDGFVHKTAHINAVCVRRTSLSCHGDGFLKFSGLKLPDTERSWYDRNISHEDCRTLCMKNCSCTAYAALDISKGASGCLLWFNDLTDIEEFPEVNQDIYIRMARTEVGERDANVINEHEKEDLELPTFDLSTISSVTNNFSPDNKLGQGGFGSVYKGILDDGREIAVKRLSKNSRQGLQEFKNEVIHIAKLQHRNLVRLLGYCIQAGERLLVYEFMPNKSLDSFIFGLFPKKPYSLFNSFGIIFC